MTENPILILDDDTEDLEMIKEACSCLRIPNKLLFFKNTGELVDHLERCDASPFLIICDLMMPVKNGFEVRSMLLDRPSVRYKTVPFIFWSTSASEKQIQHAYDIAAQGFFLKPSGFSELCETLKTIVAYWKLSQHPKKL